MINLDDEDIMSAKDASQKWGKSEDYVRQMYRKYPDKFPPGSIRKFGKQLVVTRQGMETVTGVKKID
ncbi:helix-turn-helix domain-containing protein [Weissella viridescens]|uniref:helix-turn-helix domain-containing protein n=1 Tax=Weissella viridescens TaxID=1629 RepID=UPI003528C414